MKCLACGWNAKNVSDVSFCPTCGDDWNIVNSDGRYVSTEIESCPKCLDQMLYWQMDNHTCEPSLWITFFANLSRSPSFAPTHYSLTLE